MCARPRERRPLAATYPALHHEEVPKAPNARAKLKRDEAIIRDRARGITWITISEQHGISARQAQVIWAEHLRDAHPAIEHIDPVDALREHLAQLESVLEDAAVLAE